MKRRRSLVALAAVYLAAMVLAPFLPVAIIAGAAVLAAGIAGWTWRSGADRPTALVGSWPALHLALLSTGGAASPLLPLVVLWAFGWHGARRRWAGSVAVVVALALVAAASWSQLVEAPVLLAALTFTGLVGAVLSAGLTTGRGNRETPGTTASDAPAENPQPRASDGRGMLEGTLEFVRRAVGSEDAALWQSVPGRRSIRRVARSGEPAMEGGPSELALEGHPFRWAIEERMHVRLDPGRKDLPVPGAEGMLLVPLDPPGNLLVLAYAEEVPDWVEPAAHAAALHMAEVLNFLARQRVVERQEGRLGVLLDAVRRLPGELSPDRFGDLLAQAVVRATTADGAAVASWDPELGRGVVIGRAPEGKHEPLAVKGEASHLAIALKHGTPFKAEDLLVENGSLPLLGADEVWGRAPRSVRIRPLVVAGRAIGAVVAWNAHPARFVEADEEVLDLLASIAALPLRNALDYAALDRLATTDNLTGLPNRGSFETRLSALGHHFERYGRPFGLIVGDVDYFKSFNDSHGHEAGDEVLREVAAVFRDAVRQVDLPARMGGEEFVVLLPETGLAESREVAERIRRAVEARAVSWNGRSLRVTLSLGVAACPESTTRPEELLADADAALYRAKGEGRNRVMASEVAGVK
jgi:diguanylate cyclase (GGDEF)-like protein